MSSLHLSAIRKDFSFVTSNTIRAPRWYKRGTKREERKEDTENEGVEGGGTSEARVFHLEERRGERVRRQK
jgi:hypothetical protein